MKYQEVKKDSTGSVPWLMPIIPALWKAKVGDITRGQEFKTSLASMLKPHLY